MTTVTEGTVLWQPSENLKKNARLAHYMNWLATNKHLAFDDYHALWQWSTTEIEAFWESIWQYFDIKSTQSYISVLNQRDMPGAKWFEGARINIAEHMLRHHQPNKTAIMFQSETADYRAKNNALPLIREVTWDALVQSVGMLQRELRAMGVGRGDRVVAYAPNTPETLIAFLASASLGAIWSSCSPDIGASAVLDRFKQIEPKVIFVIDGYVYNGKLNDRQPVVAELLKHLPTLTHVIKIDYLGLEDANNAPNSVIQKNWGDIVAHDRLQAQPADPNALFYEHVPFDHPLWVLYSSGTTGLPKPITHSQGGVLIEDLKILALHNNFGPDDRFFWFTTTGWMMWNYLIGGLLVGATILMYDGSPGLNNMDALWEFAERSQMTFFGTSAAYVIGCMKAGVKPNQQHDLSKLQAMGSTGSPLPIESFVWIYENIKHDLWLISTSGGTDVCTAFIGGNPLWSVHAGEMQCRCLGCAIEAFDDAGKPVYNDVGELVITQPMPSMPVFFWNDAGMKRYRESYFDMYRTATGGGIWRHGDWLKITPHNGLIIYGRSDSTINRQGVRMGTSEIYSAVEEVPEVLDSLIIDLEVLGRQSYMPLFVVMREGVALDDAICQKIKDKIKARLSARQVPDAIFAIDEVPRTLNGKKMEVPIKKILLGQALEKAVTPGSMSNPQSLQFFIRMAQQLKK
jgi:acetoacetyl-CoA synthetase